jgi:N-acetylglutamate synthase-like GNAT family acetyltransferase
MLSSSRFTVHLMREEDRIPALTLLINSFFRDEPLAKCLELGEPMDFAKNVINGAVNDQCSFVAYDIQTNQLVGICLNEVKYKEDKSAIDESNEKIYFILHLLEHMHKNINLFDQFMTNSLLHIFIINVDNTYRGCGLASRLISSSIEHAKKLHMGGAYAEATSFYSLNSFKQQGFQIYHQLNYAEYDQVRLSNLTDKNYNQCQLVAKAL